MVVVAVEWLLRFWLLFLLWWLLLLVVVVAAVVVDVIVVGDVVAVVVVAVVVEVGGGGWWWLLCWLVVVGGGGCGCGCCCCRSCFCCCRRCCPCSKKDLGVTRTRDPPFPFCQRGDKENHSHAGTLTPISHRIQRLPKARGNLATYASFHEQTYKKKRKKTANASDSCMVLHLPGRTIPGHGGFKLSKPALGADCQLPPLNYNLMSWPFKKKLLRGLVGFAQTVLWDALS